MNRGYIRHYRATREHWLHDNANYYMAWFDIIMLVNHEEKKLLIDGEVLICKRGEALYSLDSWSTKFGKWWTKQKVRTFFKLLQADNMVHYSGMRKTTRLSVVNYDKYNTSQHTDNTQPTRSQHTDNTQITPTKELISIKKELKEKEPTLQTFNYEKIKDLYNSICVDLSKCLKMSTKRKDKIKTRLKDLPELKDWENLFKVAQDTPFCKGNNDRNWKADLDWLIKNDDNYVKVLERKYDSLGNQAESKQQEIKWNPVD